MDVSSAMIEDVDDLDLIPDEELEETYLERIMGLRGRKYMNSQMYLD